MSMEISYEAHGRTRQKARTRSALVEAARELLARGEDPTVEAAAEVAGVSRATAYRYFPNRRELVLAAHPVLDKDSLLPSDAPDDPTERLEIAVREFVRLITESEPEYRAALRLALAATTSQDERTVLRRGRAIGWIEEALAPLRTTRSEAEVRRLAIAIRAACGIEALVWLTDVARLDRREAAKVMRSNAHAILAAAIR
jgi:AcrR family transcriptional regulator